MGTRSLSILMAVFLFVSPGLARKGSPAEVEPTKAFKYHKESSTGPTVYLDFEGESLRENSVSAFMYFVPMISLVPVESETNPANQQKARIISCRSRRNSRSFEAVCEFAMFGDGYYMNTFDSSEMIEQNCKTLDGRKPLKNMLDYIKFEGPGYGTVQVEGKINQGVETVTSVEISFNSDGQKSPVTIGLYSVKPVEGKYSYNNRYNCQVARVNTISFGPARDEPTMAIQIDSISPADGHEGLVARIKGRIANLFIDPLLISEAGNQAMLDFSYALYKKHATFTFPKAENLKVAEKSPQKDKDIDLVASAVKPHNTLAADKY